jgi:hypothetical protein
MTVTIRPMPESYRKITKKFRPQHPPVFTNCEGTGPSPEDIELARELFKLLDAESRNWYGGTVFLKKLSRMI